MTFETKAINLGGNSYLLTKKTETFPPSTHHRPQAVDTLILNKVMPDGSSRAVQKKVVEREFAGGVAADDLSRRVTKENLITGEKSIVEEARASRFNRQMDRKTIHLTCGDTTDVEYILTKKATNSNYRLRKLGSFLIEPNLISLDNMTNSAKRIIKMLFR